MAFGYQTVRINGVLIETRSSGFGLRLNEIVKTKNRQFKILQIGFASFTAQNIDSGKIDAFTRKSDLYRTA